MIRTYRLRSLARVSSSLRSRSQNIRNDDSVDQNIQIFLSIVEIVIEISLDPEQLFPFLSNKNKEEEDVFLVRSQASLAPLGREEDVCALWRYFRLIKISRRILSLCCSTREYLFPFLVLFSRP